MTISVMTAPATALSATTAALSTKRAPPRLRLGQRSRRHRAGAGSISGKPVGDDRIGDDRIGVGGGLATVSASSPPTRPYGDEQSSTTRARATAETLRVIADAAMSASARPVGSVWTISPAATSIPRRRRLWRHGLPDDDSDGCTLTKASATTWLHQGGGA
jgi:hypothetical protein